MRPWVQSPNVCLIIARAEEGLRKSGLPRVDRHKCTAEQPHVGYTETPWEKVMVQEIMGVFPGTKMAVWMKCPGWEEKELRYFLLHEYIGKQHTVGDW